MDSDLFDEVVQLYTDAEDAKDSRLSDASKLPQELRKSKLCAMIKLARALRKSGRLALSINKLVNVISEISIKLARASRKRGHNEQARPRPHLPPPYLFPGHPNRATLIVEPRYSNKLMKKEKIVRSTYLKHKAH